MKAYKVITEGFDIIGLACGSNRAKLRYFIALQLSDACHEYSVGEGFKKIRLLRWHEYDPWAASQDKMQNIDPQYVKRSIEINR